MVVVAMMHGRLMCIWMETYPFLLFQRLRVEGAEECDPVVLHFRFDSVRGVDVPGVQALSFATTAIQQRRPGTYLELNALTFNQQPNSASAPALPLAMLMHVTVVPSAMMQVLMPMPSPIPPHKIDVIQYTSSTPQHPPADNKKYARTPPKTAPRGRARS